MLMASLIVSTFENTPAWRPWQEQVHSAASATAFQRRVHERECGIVHAFESSANEYPHKAVKVASLPVPWHDRFVTTPRPPEDDEVSVTSTSSKGKCTDSDVNGDTCVRCFLQAAPGPRSGERTQRSIAISSQHGANNI
jgi:hypothetical protein